MEFYPLNPTDFSITFNSIPIEHFADDDWIEIEINSTGFDDYVGIDGRVVRMRKHDQRGNITFSLPRISPSNRVLMALYNAKLNKTGPVIIRNKEGATIFEGDNAWVQGPPRDFGSESGKREWTIRGAKLETNSATW